MNPHVLRTMRPATRASSMRDALWSSDMEIRKRIREFVTSNFYVANPSELLDDASLLDQAIIDSTGVLEVIAFLEEEYAISIADEEVIPENLETIARIASFVTRKTMPAGSPCSLEERSPSSKKEKPRHSF